MPEEALIVGIDFGTTYSGVAWNYTGDPETITTITQWAGANENQPKVPTLLAYSQKDPSKYKWGAQVKPDFAYPVSWFKLLLEGKTPSAHQEDHVIGSLAGLSLQTTSSQSWTSELAEKQIRSSIANIPKGKTPVDLVADYLRCLHQQAQLVMRDTYCSWSEKIPVKYYLTVPAGWSDKAKALTLQAARMSGILEEGKTDVNLMSEPEAAALHCFKAFQGTENGLKVGDVYVLADCGGGTVDLISYEVTATEPQLKVKECVAGTHGFCGSTSLNRRFEDLIKRRLGTRVYNEMSPHARWNTLTYFDRSLKTSFHPPLESVDDDFEEDSFHIPVAGVPNNSSKGIYGGFLVLSGDEMKSVFEPTFEAISKLIQDQICAAGARSGKDITGVLLVGGFGSSRYLLQYLSSSLKSPNGNGIDIRQPANAWTAVVRGAVLHGLATHQESAMVQSRIARFSYGLKVMKPFIFGSHPQSKLYFDELQGVWFCKERMSWFVKKGDEIPDGKPLVMPLTFSSTHLTGESMERMETIYCSNTNTPPDDANHDDVQELLDFTMEILEIKKTRYIKRKTSPHDGRLYWQIAFDAVMRYGSGALIFSTEVGGREVGKTPKIEYHHQAPALRITA